MDGFEINKIMGAITGTLAVFLAIHILSDGVFGKGPGAKEQKLAYALETPEPGGGDTPAEIPFATLLAQADPADGKRLFGKCSGCHQIEKGKGNSTGPELYGVVGRQIAGKADFKYGGLAAIEGDWTFEELNAFLENPKGYAPGSAMALKTRKPEDRAALIAFLNSQSDSPLPVPAAPAAEEAPVEDNAVPATE